MNALGSRVLAAAVAWWQTPRTRAEWRMVVYKLGGIAIVLGFLGFLGSVEATSKPSFCRSCHVMEPYYQAWVTSSHKEIDCIQCHMTPGLIGTWRAKLQGLSQLVKYYTNTAGTKPWAEVDDASCLRSGCHETRLLEGKVTFGGIQFDHKPHLTETRRGRRLKCTACHSQVVMGDHMTVTTSTCILCHFKGQDGFAVRPAEATDSGAPPSTVATPGLVEGIGFRDAFGHTLGAPAALTDAQKDSNCLRCHTIPDTTIWLPGNRPFQHRALIKRGVSCQSCHGTVTRGDGFVPKTRCFVCHNFPVDELLADHQRLHQVHVTDHKIECVDCHEEITHGYDADRARAPLDCLSCHAGRHEATTALAEGTAARLLGEAQPRVGPMLAARVECMACHKPPAGAGASDSHPWAEVTHRPDRNACADCHGTYGNAMLSQWTTYFARRQREVEAALRSSRQSPAVIAKAREMIETVRRGRFVHNADLARDLLDEAERLAKGLGRTPAEDRAGGGACLDCHVEGAPSGSFRVGKSVFSHAPHVGRAGMDCERCHEPPSPQQPRGRHGQMRLEGKDCVSCHHWQQRTCEGCHRQGPEQPIAWRGLTFPHKPHATSTAACGRCHVYDASIKVMQLKVTPQDCRSCHHAPATPGGQPPAACAACHNAGPDRTFTVGGKSFPHPRHRSVDCRSCHMFSSPRPGAAAAHRVEADCQGCHHQSQVACATCHGEGPAQPVAFRSTRFPHDVHVGSLACADCHKPTPPGTAGSGMRLEPGCPQCHHEAEMKPACSSCHGAEGPTQPVTWRGIRFPHAVHAGGLACADCHKATPQGLRLEAGCPTCHHVEGAAPACATCHGAEGPKDPVTWRQARFPHDIHAGNLACNECHKLVPEGPQAPRGIRLEAGCPTCHHAEGVKPACAACHGTGPAEPVPTRWQPFPHGKHAEAGLACADCHKTDRPKPAEFTCATCHEEAK